MYVLYLVMFQVFLMSLFQLNATVCFFFVHHLWFLTLLYNKQITFFIYATFGKSHLDPPMGQNQELLVTELVQHSCPLVVPCFSAQFILIKLVKRGQFLELSSYSMPICRVLLKTYLVDQTRSRNTNKHKELRY